MTEAEWLKLKRASMLVAAMKKHRRTGEYPRSTKGIKRDFAEQLPPSHQPQQRMGRFEFLSKNAERMLGSRAEISPETPISKLGRPDFAEHLRRSSTPSTRIEDVRRAHHGSMEGGGESTARKRVTSAASDEQMARAIEGYRRDRERRKRRRSLISGGTMQET